MSKTKTYYLHTLGGKPAAYDKKQIVLVTQHWTGRLCKNLKQIREEQRMSEEYREKMGFRDRLLVVGYRRVSIPEAT